MKKMVNMVDVIGKEIEIYKAKMLLFTAISGGSWVYAFKLDGVIFTIALLLAFFISSYGIFSNVLKLSDLLNELKGLKNG
jgi:hypothetical protein